MVGVGGVGGLGLGGVRVFLTRACVAWHGTRVVLCCVQCLITCVRSSYSMVPPFPYVSYGCCVCVYVCIRAVVCVCPYGCIRLA